MRSGEQPSSCLSSRCKQQFHFILHSRYIVDYHHPFMEEFSIDHLSSEHFRKDFRQPGKIHHETLQLWQEQAEDAKARYSKAWTKDAQPRNGKKSWRTSGHVIDCPGISSGTPSNIEIDWRVTLNLLPQAWRCILKLDFDIWNLIFLPLRVGRVVHNKHQQNTHGDN